VLVLFEHGLLSVLRRKVWPVIMIKTKMHVFEEEQWVSVNRERMEALCSAIKYALLPLLMKYSEENDLPNNPYSDFAELSAKFYSSLTPRKVETAFKDMFKQSVGEKSLTSVYE